MTRLSHQPLTASGPSLGRDELLLFEHRQGALIKTGQPVTSGCLAALHTAAESGGAPWAALPHDILEFMDKHLDPGSKSALTQVWLGRLSAPTRQTVIGRAAVCYGFTSAPQGERWQSYLTTLAHSGVRRRRGRADRFRRAFTSVPVDSADAVLAGLLTGSLSPREAVQRFPGHRTIVTRAVEQNAVALQYADVSLRHDSELKMFGFARIKAGEFTMGSPADEAGRFGNESPRLVELTRAFWYQSTPVTQGQWQSLMGSNPSRFHADGPDGDLACERPVEQVNWYEAAAYCNALSLKEGLSPYYDLIGSSGTPGTASWVNPSRVSFLALGVNSYRLPSEAQQQRARRGSDALTCNNATYAPAGHGLSDIAWHCENARGRTHAVGRLLPTNEGVYDALGNVWEWGNDWYAEHVAAVGANGKLTDPAGPDAGATRVCSGGGWCSPVRGVRAALRYFVVPSARDADLGFRPSRCAPGQAWAEGIGER